jgi:hypothetical protein
MRWFLACLVCLLLALVLERWHSSERALAPRSEPGGDARAPLAQDGAQLESSAADARAELQPPAQAVPEPAPADDLLELLRRVALQYAAQNAVALGETLSQLVRTPARCEEALLLLEKGGLHEDELACTGAVFALGAAVSCYASAACPVPVDAHAFTVRVLEGLADVLPPEQQDLADQLIQARDGERYVLDLSYLGRILELRRLHPEQAELYSGLLVHLAENLSDERGLEEFRALFLTEGQDPTAVKLSLCALLRTDAASWLPLAEDLFADAHGNQALRGAIAYAIASAAPVELAAASLTRLANGSMYNEFALLGMRAGGAEALAAHYSELAGSGGNPVARKLLVSGLRGEPEPVLVGIAATDPDPAVRTQALLTSSLGRASGSGLLDQLEALHSQRSDPARGIPSAQAVMVAGNVLINSAGAERERAKELLLRIAGDPAESDADRLSAVRTLRPWMPPGTFDAWVIGGQNPK